MIISTLLNFEKLKNRSIDIIRKINNKIMKLFEENEEFGCLFNIFVNLVNVVYGNVQASITPFKVHLDLISFYIRVRIFCFKIQKNILDKHEINLNMSTKINFVLENFHKLALIYEEEETTSNSENAYDSDGGNNFSNNLAQELIKSIMPIVFIDLEQNELNFDNEEVKQEYDYRKNFFMNICNVSCQGNL